MEEIEKARDRLEVLERIKEMEKNGIFDIDADFNLPTIELLPNQIDYKRKKLKNKILRFFAYKGIVKFVKKMQKIGMFQVKEIKGIENLKSVKTGAILTCNHFGAQDSFAMDLAFTSAKLKHKRMFKVIREGNFTNPPKGFEAPMKYCDTLPLSQNKSTMKKFMRCTNELIQEGNFVLIYPEEAMWWNYRKPRPLKNGAFRFAIKNNVPVVPMFVTMQDSEQIGPDGFPIQIHTMHIEKPIYADSSLNLKQNIDQMKLKNYQIWQDIYEKTYGIPLKYLCDEK